MGRISISSLGLWIGAAGQRLLLTAWVPLSRLDIILIALFVPWLTVYTISFCKEPPFGPRRFRHCLLFAMGWYTVMTLCTETVQVLTHLNRHNHIVNVMGQVLTYTGALSFIVFFRACVELRRYETMGVALPEPGETPPT